MAKNATSFKKKDKRINMNGRPKGARGLTTQVKEALLAISEGQETTEQEQLVQTILKKAKGGDVAMIKLMWNYMEGMPQQRIEQNITGTISLTELFNKAQDDK